MLPLPVCAKTWRLTRLMSVDCVSILHHHKMASQQQALNQQATSSFQGPLVAACLFSGDCTLQRFNFAVLKAIFC